MRIAVTGASGFLGSALVPALRADGHHVLRLVRRATREADEVRWDPRTGQLDAGALEGVAAAVHLTGAGVGDRRWTRAYRREIRESRVLSTRTLSRALAALHPRPEVLLSASAIGYYGATGDMAVDESAGSGTTFLAGVVRDWEAATEPAREAGIRVAHLRTGLVMDRRGGAFARLLPLVRLGLAGPLGSGRQYWSWITLADELRAVRFLLERELAGPVNLTAPAPARNRDLVRALARAAHRPALLPVPPFALRLVVGQFASEILISQRVLPRRLLQAGFSFSFPGLDTAVPAVLGGSAPG